jgi:hypothetical protein
VCGTQNEISTNYSFVVVAAAAGALIQVSEYQSMAAAEETSF